MFASDCDELLTRLSKRFAKHQKRANNVLLPRDERECVRQLISGISRTFLSFSNVAIVIAVCGTILHKPEPKILTRKGKEDPAEKFSKHQKSKSDEAVVTTKL